MAPRDHEWDGVLGAYVHKETRAVHVKGTRSAASAAQQKERKDTRKDTRTRDRGERPQASGCQHRMNAEVEAQRADANRRRQMVSKHRRAAREKAAVPLGESDSEIRKREEQRLLGEHFVLAGQRVRATQGEHAGQCLTLPGFQVGNKPYKEVANAKWKSVCLTTNKK